MAGADCEGMVGETRIEADRFGRRVRDCEGLVGRDEDRRGGVGETGFGRHGKSGTGERGMSRSGLAYL